MVKFACKGTKKRKNGANIIVFLVNFANISNIIDFYLFVSVIIPIFVHR